MFRLMLTLSLLSVTTAGLCAGARPEDMAWFHQARFGMFIHWGPYSLKGVEASWPLYGGAVPREEYEALATQFNPTQFDARAIVGLAKRAGMKYLVITSKHHDGFAMFDTKLSEYSIMHSPYGKDICRMVVEACREEGLRVGFYFSLCDWHHPDYMTAPQTGPLGPGLLPEELDAARWERFVEFMHGQVRELCTNYGRLDIMWFDGGWEHTAEQWKSAQLHAMIRELQPHILINDRGGGGFGDYGTPEQTVPETGMGRPWETCMTINNTWAYNPNDRAFKSVDDLLTILAKTSSGGGNLLLNIGPMPTGQVQPEFVERLEAIGKWLELNGESVYGVGAGPRKLSPENRVARKDDRLFVHILNPPDDGRLVLHSLLSPVTEVTLLSTGQPLPHIRQEDDVVVDLSGVQRPLKHEVVAVRFAGELDVDLAIRADAAGAFTLQARDVTAHGTNVCYQPTYDDIGCWWNLDDWVSWQVRVEREGDYEVVINQGAPENEGGTFTLTVGQQEIAGTVQVTGGWTAYEETRYGPVHLAPGIHEVKIKPEKLTGFALMNVKSVKLVPR